MSLSGPPTTRLELATDKLNFYTLPWQDRSELRMSDLDLLLRSKWEAALGKKLFLHGVESEPYRMHGDKGYVALLCRNRASCKRKPQSFNSILQKVDPDSFNFTKIKPAEILFSIEDDENGCFCSDCVSVSSVNANQETAVIINNSPFEYAHCILVPNILERRIQSITFEAIKMGIRVLLSSTHPGFRVMYNSLCAGASVNHLHLHCYYTEYWLPSEAFRMIPILPTNGGTEISEFFELHYNDFGVCGFGFVITKENYKCRLPRMVHRIVQYFNTNNIAHNIVIMRGIPPSAAHVSDVIPIKGPINLKSNEQSESYPADIMKNSNIPTIEQTTPYSHHDHVPAALKVSPLLGRLYIFPRQPIYGEKSYRKFLVNVTELFGHLYFGDVALYESMDESDVIKALNNVSFSEQQFGRVKNEVTKILTDSF